jgi:hypothetical protein
MNTEEGIEHATWLGVFDTDALIQVAPMETATVDLAEKPSAKKLRANISFFKFY